MCGIAGYSGPRELDGHRLDAAMHALRRRGPDDRSRRLWVGADGRRCHLLHTRLSIIDLDRRSKQPFQVGHKSIIFNGELYNYRELRRDLVAVGYAFRTESDTEVLLAAIDRFGWSVLDRCEGMWAFAVYDEADGSLTLCRDRFGEKPLYLLREHGRVFFASEPKAVAALRGKPLAVDEDHLCRFLVNGYKSLYKQHGRTFFQELTEVHAGTLLRIANDGTETCQRYWQPVSNIDGNMTYAEAVAGARERLIRSVELRLRADVPIAFCMSGGVDSNSLIGIAKNVFDYDVHGFTIHNTDSRYEEQDVIEQSVAELGIRHTNIPVNTEDFLPKLREIVVYHDAPVYTITYFAHWLLMQSVAEHGYRISVSGTAADELFTGYFDHHLFYLAEIHEDAELYQRAKLGWERTIKPMVRNPFLRDPDRFVASDDFREHIFLKNDEFADRLTRFWREPFTEQRFTDRVLRNRMLNELFHEATPVILHEDDANAMFFSIENRSPFLDRGLFEFCNQIPTRHLIRDGMAKVILRDAMRGIVPNCVLDNPRKVGFNAPIFSFLDVNHSPTREALLDRSPVFDLVRREAVESMLGLAELPNSESKFLFSFLSVKMFLEEFASASTPAIEAHSIALNAGLPMSYDGPPTNETAVVPGKEAM